MSANDHDRWRELIGLAALAPLDPAEDAELRAHLADCSWCRRDAEHLRAMAALLPAADPWSAAVEPDPALRERIVAAVGDTRRRDTRRDRLQRALAVAAAAVFLVGVGAVLNRPAPGPTLEEVALADVPADVAADAALITHTWGTELVLTVDGLQDGQDYVVTFVSDAGERVSAGTFIGVDDRPVVCRMNAAVLRNEASAFEVATPDGRLVMRADI